jgi:type I restriction enzyme S subunit
VVSGVREQQVPNGYKQTELGIIPESWSVASIGSIGRFKNGINKDGDSFGHGYPFVNLMDVFGKTSIGAIENLGLIDSNDVDKKEYDLRIGDVLFIRSSVKPSGVGLTAVVKEDLVGAVYSGFLIRYRSDSKLSTEFKEYCFYNNDFRKRIVAASSVSANTNINQDNLKQLLLVYPQSLEEQTAIANALSDVDALITSLEKLITKKRAIKTAAMQQLLTGKKRLPPFDQIHTGYKQTELGEIPEDWEINNFADIAAPKNSRINPKVTGGKEFCIELEHVDQGTGTVNGSSLTTSESSLKNVFTEGDILFGKLRSYLRKYWRADRSGVCSTEIWVLKANEQRAIPPFIFQTVQTDDFIDCTSESYGTHMPRSDWKIVKFFLVATPSIDEQISIASVLSDMDQEIIALSNRLNKTQKLKQGMMQELLTGRTRLI